MSFLPSTGCKFFGAPTIGLCHTPPSPPPASSRSMSHIPSSQLLLLMMKFNIQLRSDASRDQSTSCWHRAQWLWQYCWHRLTSQHANHSEPHLPHVRLSLTVVAWFRCDSIRQMKLYSSFLFCLPFFLCILLWFYFHLYFKSDTKDVKY